MGVPRASRRGGGKPIESNISGAPTKMTCVVSLEGTGHRKEAVQKMTSLSLSLCILMETSRLDSLECQPALKPNQRSATCKAYSII